IAIRRCLAAFPVRRRNTGTPRNWRRSPTGLWLLRRAPRGSGWVHLRISCRNASIEKMKVRVAIVGVFGLLVVGYLIWYVGFGPVFSAVFKIGWPGFSLLCALGFVLFALLGSAWWVLVPGPTAQGWRTFLWARMVRDSAAETLPFSQIGG